ncbi:hypothetical protein ACFOY2_37775 [Nonomuraea purpurea]|uniref:GNAT family N-acetyltransferase n=1 Tax=Nonomuraea purpurea TaxID=1849276 RepID=A0ABV8GK08_9ACTN
MTLSVRPIEPVDLPAVARVLTMALSAEGDGIPIRHEPELTL